MRFIVVYCNIIKVPLYWKLCFLKCWRFTVWTDVCGDSDCIHIHRWNCPFSLHSLKVGFEEAEPKSRICDITNITKPVLVHYHLHKCDVETWSSQCTYMANGFYSKGRTHLLFQQEKEQVLSGFKGDCRCFQQIICTCLYLSRRWKQSKLSSSLECFHFRFTD